MSGHHDNVSVTCVARITVIDKMAVDSVAFKCITVHFENAFLIMRLWKKHSERKLSSYCPVITHARLGRDLSPENYSYCQGERIERRRRGPF